MKFVIYTLLCAVTALAPSRPVATGKSVFTFDDFPKTVELKGTAIALPGIERPVRLTLIPEKHVLICYEAVYSSKKKWLHIYSLDSFKLIRSVINYGDAEDEMTGVFQLQYDKRNGGEVYMTDIIRQQVVVYNADSLIAGKTRPLRIVGKPFTGNQSFNVYDNRLMRAVVIDKAHTIIDTRGGASNHTRMLFNKYDSHLSVRDSFGRYPATTQEVSPAMLGQTLDGSLGISTDNKYIAFSGITSDYLAVYDTTGKMIASAIGPGGAGISYESSGTGDGERLIASPGHYAYACKARINKDMVYALYNGKAGDEHSSDLLQFTAQLKPAVRYKLNISLFDFDIDWRTMRLYGFRREGDTNQLVVFQL